MRQTSLFISIRHLENLTFQESKKKYFFFKKANDFDYLCNQEEFLKCFLEISKKYVVRNKAGVTMNGPCLVLPLIGLIYFPKLILHLCTELLKRYQSQPRCSAALVLTHHLWSMQTERVGANRQKD